MSKRTRARIAAATSAALVGGGLALGLLAGGGSVTIVAGGNDVRTVVAPVTAAVISGSGLGAAHSSGTSLG